jgi:hypothetical protein
MVRGMRHRGLVLGICISVIVAPGLAEARSAKHARFLRLVKKAEGLYPGGRYSDAAATLQQAYEVESNSRVLYNIARALDQAGNLKIANYRQYFAAERPDSTLAQRATLAVDRLRGVGDLPGDELKQSPVE